MAEVILDGGPIDFADVIAVAHGGVLVRLADSVAARMEPARQVVEQAVAEDRIVYGVTTGFGAMASTHISREDAAELQVSLLRSHATGVGGPVSAELVRLMMLLRARTLSQGHSGVRVEVVNKILELLNAGLLPVVPSRGSVGASGDLAPFAHLMLPIIGEGRLVDGGEPGDAAEVMARHGIEALMLKPKEGLSLLNGTEGMLAYGILGVHRAVRLAKAVDVVCAMSVEALMGSARPFDPRVHELRPHPGQAHSAANIVKIIAGSSIEESHHEDFVHAVQDAYSLRCAPQVHGASRDTIEFARVVFEREGASVVDNPIVFPDSGDVVSAGNFHGQPLAFALDYLAMAVSEFGAISERRVDRMLDPTHSAGLPPFLTRRPGVESGYMLTQYTAAALVAENRVLSHPASVDSIPTSGSQEDHVSMGWGAGRKLAQVLDNTARVVGIELLCAAEGVEHRAPLQPGTGTAAAVAAVRRHVAPLEADRVLSGDIEAAADLVQTGGLVAAVESAVGELA